MRTLVTVILRCAVVLLAGSHCAALQLFSPSSFTIRRQVGQLGFATETEWQYYGGPRNPLDPSQPARTVEASGISVRLFDALLGSGERVLLKEFLAPALDIGERELAVHEHLQARALELGGPVLGGAPPQVNALLGLLRTDRLFETEAFRKEWTRALPNTPPPDAGELWLIFRWEGLSTIAGFPRAPQTRAWWDLDGRVARAARKRFLKVMVARSLQVVGWLHEAGVVHRSIGTSSLLLSTYDEKAPEKLFVKVIDLGFGSTAMLLPPEDVASAMSRGAESPLEVMPLLERDDLHCLAYVILEVLLTSSAASYAAGGGRGVQIVTLELQSLKRLVEDVFDGDVIDQMREYVLQEPKWAMAVELLDEGERSGWEVLQQLIDCRHPASVAARLVSAQALLRSRWFQV
ncbi:hypothetical protein AB1Y20_005534 [Prymnesium parvum]|uniref:Protein kinase domain-containing protein n=1 Tax=Prymnesium parvum TaxID=97485 RepID=A0AB34J7H8_PRYPA